MDEHVCKDASQDSSLRRVSANLVDLVDTIKTTAFQHVEELIDERIGDVASECERVIEEVDGSSL
jgi:hypothetical protein